jgi:type IV pilus assembly protein PilY1
VLHIAKLQDAVGAGARAQPITTRMALTHIGANRVIYVGTGRYLGNSDLADPGAASGIAWQQSIYAIKDKVVDTNTDYGNIRNANLVVQTLTNTSTTTRSTTTLAVDWNKNDGWMIDLNPLNSTPGERVNVDPELIIGTLVIASNIPTTSAACTVGGESFLYQFDFKTGQYVANSLNNVAGTLLGGITVGMAVIQLPSGAIKDIVTTADTSKTSQGVNVGAATAYLKRFSYRER